VVKANQGDMKVRFWSSTQYSGFLEGLMRELTAAGFDAKQCYQISEASYRSAKSAPARLFLRFRQYVAYPIQLCVVLVLQWIRFISCRLFGYRFLQRETRKLKTGQLRARDVCVVSTNTFYAPLIATYLHPNVVHLVYDLFPEAMIHSGKWTEGTLKVKFIRWITKQTLKRAKTNVFLGERLKTYVESIHGPVPNSAIIAVGADQALFRRSPKERLKCEGMNVEKCESKEAEDRRQREGGCPHPLSLDESARQEYSDLSIRQINEETVNTFPPSHSSRESSPTILYCGNFGNMHDSATLFDYWKRSSDALQPASSSDVLQPSSSSDVLPPSSSVTDATIEVIIRDRLNRFDSCPFITL
jgi:hypothetical protein